MATRKSIILERDLAVPARDGTRLFVNLFRPPAEGPRPVIMSVTSSTLQLTIQGHDAARYPAFGHRQLVNRGCHTIFTGGPYDSCLVVPLNNRGSQ
jgi:predicted acyl esterase